MGDKQNQPVQLSFNASLKVDFQGSRVTSDGGGEANRAKEGGKGRDGAVYKKPPGIRHFFSRLFGSRRPPGWPHPGLSDSLGLERTKRRLQQRRLEVQLKAERKAKRKSWRSALR